MKITTSTRDIEVTMITQQIQETPRTETLDKQFDLLNNLYDTVVTREETVIALQKENIDLRANLSAERAVSNILIIELDATTQAYQTIRLAYDLVNQELNKANSEIAELKMK